MPTATGHTTAISATRVIGTSVFNSSGEKLGRVEDIILDKTNDRIKFAVISVGGPLVATDNFYPLPWDALDYDEENGGYVVPFTREQLVEAPSVGKVSDLTHNDGSACRDAALAHFKSGKGS